MTSYSHLLGSSTKIPMLILEYYDQWADRMEDYLNGLDEELWDCINGIVQPPVNLQNIGSFATTSAVGDQQTRLNNNKKRCMRELRGVMPPLVYNYILGCKTSKEIWNILKEKYQGSEKTKINSVKQCLVELKEFRQKETETIEVYYDRLNELIYRCNRYGITRSLMEYNLTFVMGLRKEWRSVSMMIKNQQSFDNSSLNDVYNQLKTHESEEFEIMEEAKQNDEAVAFYLNNRVKKFLKRPFNTKGKKSEMKGNFTKSGVAEKKKFEKPEKNDDKVKEFKSEKKLKGDSGVDCHYRNGVNHFAIDCMLQKKEEKKNRVKDEAYYAEKVEEVCEKAKGLSLEESMKMKKVTLIRFGHSGLMMRK
ncbi:uncharacterized protein LOC111920326 [Lactuca sativa]|uniref:uncharacterized protein LOC111920326 n=1 Tax=Lactuca sativa TaxID=4236 RepID=UPI000CD9DC34|nr:uncharacterized protein LOC111920326 [Lactuca sativa]